MRHIELWVCLCFRLPDFAVWLLVSLFLKEVNRKHSTFLGLREKRKKKRTQATLCSAPGWGSDRCCRPAAGWSPRRKCWPRRRGVRLVVGVGVGCGVWGVEWVMVVIGKHFIFFACCGLVAEIQPLKCSNLRIVAPLPTSGFPFEINQQRREGLSFHGGGRRSQNEMS